MHESLAPAPAQGRNLRTAAVCAGVVAAMVGLSFAAVPLYDAFCRVTGYGGATRVAEAEASRILDRDVTIRFDATVNGALPWAFRPDQGAQTLKVGETGLAYYRAQNTSARPVTGVATYNVTPAKAGAYFNKIDCFCFTEQTLDAGESMLMPVAYFIDPAIADDPSLDDVTTITLSYTFFEQTPG